MRHRVVALAVVLASAAVAMHGAVRADGTALSPEAVVARVGPIEITASAVEQRLRGVPDYQLATFGSSPAEIRRAFVLRVMVPEALFAQGAKAEGLQERPDVKERLDGTLRTTRIEQLKSEAKVLPDEIFAFYSQNRARFDSPPRIAVFRILCGTREDAAQVLADAKQSSALQKWNDLAREHSIDKATAYRGGNLGFLAADGSSSEVSVKADPALFAAASRVKDGELVPEPVQEGKAFAAIWRRGSTPATHRSVEDEASAIRQMLSRQKLEESLRALLKKLRLDRGVEESPELVEAIEVAPSGDVAAKRRPGVAPRKPALPPAPSSTPRGLR